MPTDIISFNKPEVPTAAEGGPGNSRLVPVARNTADIWHGVWRNQRPDDALVKRCSEAPLTHIPEISKQRDAFSAEWVRRFTTELGQTTKEKDHAATEA